MPAPNAPAEISEDVVGTNLQAPEANTSRRIPSNRHNYNNASNNTLSMEVNSAAIDVNTREIARNSIKIDQAFARIDANSTAIAHNGARISDLEEGLAAVAALPDMYLNPNETWSAAGGVAAYGDEVGFGATLAIRGNDNWSFGASAGMGGDEATGKLQFRYGGGN